MRGGKGGQGRKSAASKGAAGKSAHKPGSSGARGAPKRDWGAMSNESDMPPNPGTVKPTTSPRGRSPRTGPPKK
jgi:hypothetical protein